MEKHQRAVMLLAAAALFFAMISSTLYIAANADHNCVGCIRESCPVCQQINFRKNLQKTLGLALAVCAIAGALVFGFVCCVSFAGEGAAQDTLISLKVKLLN